MPQALGKREIAMLAEDVAAGDRLGYYTRLANWGYKYGDPRARKAGLARPTRI